MYSSGPFPHPLEPGHGHLSSFDWGMIKWLFNGDTDPGCKLSVGVALIYEGMATPLHYHPNCDEVLYVISGECDHSFDGRRARLAPSASIFIPTGVRHNLINVGSKAVECLISFSSPDRQTVIIENET